MPAWILWYRRLITERMHHVYCAASDGTFSERSFPRGCIAPFTLHKAKSDTTVRLLVMEHRNQSGSSLRLHRSSDSPSMPASDVRLNTYCY
jgi:hypothetical protein